MDTAGEPAFTAQSFMDTAGEPAFTAQSFMDTAGEPAFTAQSFMDAAENLRVEVWHRENFQVQAVDVAKEFLRPNRTAILSILQNFS